MIGVTQPGILLAVFMACASGSLYDFYREPKTWEDARDTCSRENKQLVLVTEKLQHERIRNYNPYIFSDFWIGLRGVDSQFQWVDNSVAKFTAWGQGQPSSQSQCVRYSVTDFMWETHNCSAMLYYMCQNNVPQGKASGPETRSTGLLMGFGTILGLLVAGILMLQMPCCRTSTVKAIGHFGLGRR